MNPKNALVILAKWPEVGKTKSRIAAETSQEFAFEFSKACMRDVVENLSGSKDYNVLVGTDTEDELKNFMFAYGLEGLTVESKSVEWKKALSEKMSGLFEKLLADYEKVILIPMDVPFISKKIVSQAFSGLEERDFVVGPEHNGGIYLIGAKTFKRNLFEKIEWSTDKSCNDLVRNCGPENCRVLEAMDDLNTVFEVVKNFDFIKLGCKNTYGLIKRYGYNRTCFGSYVNYDEINLNIPVVLGIIEREGAKGEEILIQTRNKPAIDLENTGKLELPGGLIEKREMAFEAVVREIREETGLKVEVKNESQILSSKISKKSSLAFEPFCCVQQKVGDRAYIGTAFLCRVTGGKLNDSNAESKDHEWISLRELETLLSKPEQFFNLCVPVLKKYLESKKQGKDIKMGVGLE